MEIRPEAIDETKLNAMPPDPPQKLADRDAERIRIQLRRWRECLLDQTGRNPLLKRDGSRVSRLQVVTPEAETLFRMLVIEGRRLRLPLVRRTGVRGRPIEGAQEENAPRPWVERGEVVFAAGAPEIERRLRRIRDNARTSVEERGVTTLHVALGALHFADARLGGDCVAPLWLVPCRLEAHGPDKPLTLEPIDEDPSVNPSLELFLRERHKMALPAAPDECSVEGYRSVMETIADEAAERGWHVEPEAWLSTFYFESLVLRRDLVALESEAARHPVVRAFSRVAAPPPDCERLPEDLDTLPVPEQVPVPILETDSSQLEALALAAQGRNLVIHGPPGTGKSQTIANLIADALGKGKTVLFVSAKSAALEVVHRRLVEQGLGEFCLEAHSARAGKTKILSELRRTLESAEREPKSPLHDRLEDLHGVRDRLNDYVRALHAKRGRLELSLYEAIGRAEGCRHAPDLRFPLPWPDVFEVSRLELSNALETLEELAALAEDYDGRDRHAWRGLRLPAAPATEQSLEAHLESVATSALSEVASSFGELDGVTRAIEKCAALRNRLGASIDAVPREAVALLQYTCERRSGWERAFSPDHRRRMRAVRERFRPGAANDADSLRALLAVAQQAVALESWLSEEPMVKAFSPGAVLALRPAMAALDAAWPDGFVGGACASEGPIEEVATRCRGLLQAREKADRFRRMLLLRERVVRLGMGPLLDALGSRSVRLASAALERRFYFAWSAAALREDETLAAFEGDRQETLVERFREIDGAVRRAALRQVREVASRRAVEVREAPLDAREVAVLRRELVKRRSGKPLRKLFGEAPRALQSLKPCMLMSPVSVSTWLPPGSLRFDLVVFDEASQIPTPQAVPAILRASQTVVAGDPNQLPPSSFFDASIASEAGAGDPAERAGDPTPSEAGPIDAGEERDEDGYSDDPFEAPDVEPLESLLDECVASVPSFREAHLRWHYRSEDERLIRFSNHWFYEDRLITFPSTAVWTNDRGIRFVHVPDGVWDRGRTRRNLPEAHRVAEIVLDLLRESPERSLGVIAMNLGQKDAIEDAVAARLEAAPELRRVLEGKPHEPFFVKSLENVQGDERDVIVVSLGYGRDSGGSLVLNFGPLNADGGWRRLNVLITRAKRQTVVVSSMRARDLAGVNASNRGASALRDYLDYAEAGGELPGAGAAAADHEIFAPPLLGTRARHSRGGTFAEAVLGALEERGYRVDPHVGIGGCRIELGVRHPDDDSRYVLGVECDGPGYASARTARDRDVLRRAALESKGWRLHRVWSADWFRDRDRTLDRLLRAILRARASTVRRPNVARSFQEEAVTAAPASAEPVVPDPPPLPA